MEHSFNTNIAKDFDVDTAIFINNMRFWTIQKLANNEHIIDGYCWVYNSILAFCQIFPYWTRHQLEHLIKKCEKNGLLVSGNYNSHKYDRKKWYALTPKIYQYFPELQKEEYIIALWNSISEKSEMRKYLPDISEISEKPFVKFRETFLNFPRPIADSKQQIENTNNNIYPADAGVAVINNSSSKTKSQVFQLEDLLADNPYNIPEPMLVDWLTIRKGKKAKVTATAWKSINKTLALIEEKIGIKPKDAFERMVANAWQSIHIRYFHDESLPLTTVTDDSKRKSDEAYEELVKAQDARAELMRDKAIEKRVSSFGKPCKSFGEIASQIKRT